MEDLGLSFPLCPARRDFVLKPYYNKSFINQAYSFKMAEYVEGSYLYSMLLLTFIQLYKGKLDKKRERENSFFEIKGLVTLFLVVPLRVLLTNLSILSILFLVLLFSDVPCFRTAADFTLFHQSS